MLTIHLNKLLFHAPHGLYAEEQILGNQFEVNISIQQKAPTKPIVHLEQSINYVAVYALVQKRMQEPTPLLETIAQDICNGILDNFPLAEEVQCSIQKLTPPIPHFQGTVGISFVKKRSSM